jgi:hypothetical protein
VKAAAGRVSAGWNLYREACPPVYGALRGVFGFKTPYGLSPSDTHEKIDEGVRNANSRDMGALRVYRRGGSPVWTLTVVYSAAVRELKRDEP